MSSRPQVLLKTIHDSDIVAHPVCAALLSDHKDAILKEFVAEVRKELPAAKGKSKSALEDHLPELMDTMVEVLEREAHVKGQQVTEVAQEHGVQRSNLHGFTLDQVIHEYGILRRIIVKILYSQDCFDFEAVNVVQEIIQRGCEEAAREFMANSEEDATARESQLNETITKLKSEQEIREKFVSTLTHDLRTPLAAAKMSAQLILRKFDDQTIVQQLANRVCDNITRTDNLVQDLLDATRIQAGYSLKLEIIPMNLKSLVEDTLNDLTTIHGSRFDFRFSGNTQGFWCGKALRRVIENLCSNAIKYGEQHAPITVRVEGHEDSVCFAIHNKGTPLSAADKTRLFEQFTRTPAAEQSDRPGWGIGLTIVKGIVEAHRGTVEVLDVNQGTEFRIILPRDSR
jgi:signal transduction histidine kinase